MSENFSVHLVSNVSPELFPDNTPSKFSTNLANEINLSEGEWEVAVRQIMYPTHVKTTTDEDQIHVHKYKKSYRDLLPIPPKNADSIEEMGTFINLSPPKGKTPQNMIVHLLDAVNKSEWSKDKGILKLQYNEQMKILVLQIYTKDIVVWMNKTTRKYLGFKEDQHALAKGITYARSSIDNKTPPSDLKLYLCDLSIFKAATHSLQKLWDGKRDEYFYQKIIPTKYRPTTDVKYKEHENYNASFSFGVFPATGKVQMFQLRNVPLKCKKCEEKLAFIQFDHLTAAELNMNDIYTPNDFREQFKVDGLSFNISKKSVLVDETFDNNDEYFALERITVTFYYATPQFVVKDLEERPLASIHVDTKKPINKPTEMLPLLNSMTDMYDYEFSFDAHTQRFVMKNGKKYAIKLSETLNSLLGFDRNQIFHCKTTERALTFPLMERLITALYVYSNIVDAVYIGNVKAPLLLTCPFTRPDSVNVVHQQEFLNPCYVPLNRARIGQIDIAIYDDAGLLIPFRYGKTKLSLDFRRKR